MFLFRFFLISLSLQKLAHVTQERNRWLQHQTDHEKAQENLRDFQKSFRKEILVPIGSKALMPGTLYHTNEVLVSMYSDLFVKCSADKALAVCKHRLKEAQKRLEALNIEYKMYKYVECCSCAQCTMFDGEF